MPDLWSLWWVWASAALALGILELLVPGFIFLGIAAGAAIVALLVGIWGDLGLTPSLAIFAAASLISWIALKRAFKPADDQTRVVHDDINK
ncbi:MAG: hypothetical protein AAFZ04_05900 [Pseudomonadota bacterium]